MKALLISLLCLLAEASPSFAFETDWRWVRLVPHHSATPVKWEVGQGIAKNVVITGGKFRADLYAGDLRIRDPVIRLSGTISQGRVTAYAVYVGTDADRGVFHGDLRVVKTSFETDRITLKGEWADAFLGLTRVKSQSGQP